MQTLRPATTDVQNYRVTLANGDSVVVYAASADAALAVVAASHARHGFPLPVLAQRA